MGQFSALLFKNFSQIRRRKIGSMLQVFAPLCGMILLLVLHGQVDITTTTGTSFADVPKRAPQSLPRLSKLKGRIDHPEYEPEDYVLLYYPDSDNARAVMETIKKNEGVRIEAFDGLQPAIRGAYNRVWSQYALGIVGFHNNSLSGDNIAYSLYFPREPRYSYLSGIKTTEITAPDWVDVDWHKAALHRAVNEAILSVKAARKITLNLDFESFPIAPPPSSHRIELNTKKRVLNNATPLILFSVLLIPLLININILMAEKTSGILRMLRSIGLSESKYWISWFLALCIPPLIYVFLVVTLGTIGGVPLIAKTNFGVMCTILFFSALSLIAFAMAISAPFKRTRAANFGTFFILAGSLIMGIIFTTIAISNDVNRCSAPRGRLTMTALEEIFYNRGGSGSEAMFLLYLLPPFNYFRIMDIIATWTNPQALPAHDITDDIETTTGYHFGWNEFLAPRRYQSCWRSYSVTSLSPGSSVGFMVVDIIFYLVLGSYLAQIFDTGSGNTKPFYFPLLPGYWFKRKPAKALKGDTLGRLQEQSSTDSTVVLHKISKAFKDSNALKELTLLLKPGEVFCFLGHNGAGKTTTVNIISAQTAPTHGRCFVRGLDVVDDIDLIRANMGVCPQDDVLWPELSAREHLQFFALFRNVPKHEQAAEISALLDDVDLADKADRSSTTYSGGMKRRLSVAISCIGTPPVILLDEPTTGLDPLARRHVWSLIQKLKNRDRVILLTTHSMEEADLLSDRIAILSKGSLRAIGTPVFLKNRFGAGYHATLVCDENRESYLRGLIEKHMPNAEILDSSGGNMSVAIPREQAASHVPAFFKVVDTHKDTVIKEWGISNTTLEEVFMRLSAQNKTIVENAPVDRIVTGDSQPQAPLCKVCHIRPSSDVIVLTTLGVPVVVSNALCTACCPAIPGLGSAPQVLQQYHQKGKSPATAQQHLIGSNTDNRNRSTVGDENDDNDNDDDDEYADDGGGRRPDRNSSYYGSSGSDLFDDDHSILSLGSRRKSSTDLWSSSSTSELCDGQGFELLSTTDGPDDEDDAEPPRRRQGDRHAATASSSLLARPGIYQGDKLLETPLVFSEDITFAQPRQIRALMGMAWDLKKKQKKTNIFHLLFILGVLIALIVLQALQAFRAVGRNSVFDRYIDRKGDCAYGSNLCSFGLYASQFSAPSQESYWVNQSCLVPGSTANATVPCPAYRNMMYYLTEVVYAGGYVSTPSNQSWATPSIWYADLSTDPTFVSNTLLGLPQSTAPRHTLPRFTLVPDFETRVFKNQRLIQDIPVDYDMLNHPNLDFFSATLPSMGIRVEKDSSLKDRMYHLTLVVYAGTDGLRTSESRSSYYSYDSRELWGNTRYPSVLAMEKFREESWSNIPDPMISVPATGSQYHVFINALSLQILQDITKNPNATIAGRLLPVMEYPRTVAPAGSTVDDWKATFALESGIISSLLFTLLTMLLFPSSVQPVVAEREDKTHKLMSIMGLSMKNYWLAFYFFNYLQGLVIVVVILVIAGPLKTPPIVGSSVNPNEVSTLAPAIFMLLLWIHALVASAALFSALFARMKGAMMMAYMFILLSTVAGIVLLNIPSTIPSTSMYIFPQFAFMIGWCKLYLEFTSGLVECLFLFFDGVVMMGLAMLLEELRSPESWIRRKFFQLRRRTRIEQLQQGMKTDGFASDVVELERVMDEDVRAERQRVMHCGDDADYKVLIKNLGVNFGNLEAVKSLSLGLKEDTLLGLLGPNGAGKTTVISAIHGAIEPTRGSVMIGGLDVTTDLSKIRRRMGVMPQFDYLFSELTVEEHLLMYARMQGVTKDAERACVQCVAEVTQLDGDCFRKQASTLSGGQRRMLSLAIAFVHQPDVILLDEPTTGLDPEIRRAAWRVISKMVKGRAIILTTHSMEEAEALSTQIGIMVSGTLRCLGTPFHLKSKFGSGYQLTIVVPAVSMGPDGKRPGDSVQDLVLACAPGAQLLNSIGDNTFTFRIPRDSVRLSDLFGSISAPQNQWCIAEWSFSQASLEDVFIKVVEHDLVPLLNPMMV